MGAGSVGLTIVHADCPVCGERKGQIDTDRERAVRIVTDAMTTHIAEEHPEVS